MERCVLAAIALLMAGFVSAEISEELRGHLDECKSLFNVTEEDVKGITERQPPTSSEAKCYLHCIFSKLNVMTQEGKMNSEGMKTFVQQIPNMEKEDKKKLEQVADKCAEAPLSEEDACGNAVLVYDCINIESDELGVKGA